METDDDKRTLHLQTSRNTTKHLSQSGTNPLEMETMGDLLEVLRHFDSLGSSKEAAKEAFGWDVEDVTIREERASVDQVIIKFHNGLIVEARHILSEVSGDFREDWDFRLKMISDLTSTLRYNAYYSRYIHGQGYLRTDLGYINHKLLRKMIEDFYTPRLRKTYKPVILEFKGLQSYDFFGIEAGRDHSEIYYSTTRAGREEASSNIEDVVMRLSYLNERMKDEKLRKSLKDLDEDLCKVLCVLCPSG